MQTPPIDTPPVMMELDTTSPYSGSEISSVTYNEMMDEPYGFDNLDADDDIRSETAHVVSPQPFYAYPNPNPNPYNHHVNVVTVDHPYGAPGNFLAPPIEGVQDQGQGHGHGELDLDAIFGPPTLNEENFHYHHGNGRREKKRSARKYKSRAATRKARGRGTRRGTRTGTRMGRGRGTGRGRGKGKGKGTGRGKGKGKGKGTCKR